MTENIYVVYDREAQIALKPLIISRNDVEPIRQYQQIQSDEKTIIHQHPEQFELVMIGTIDLETMEIQPATMRVIGT